MFDVYSVTDVQSGSLQNLQWDSHRSSIIHTAMLSTVRGLAPSNLVNPMHAVDQDANVTHETISDYSQSPVTTSIYESVAGLDECSMVSFRCATWRGQQVPCWIDQFSHQGTATYNVCDVRHADDEACQGQAPMHSIPWLATVQAKIMFTKQKYSQV